MVNNSQLDLTQLFSTVSGVLNQNRSALNEADSYNHDHGDHMTEIFSVISQAVQQKQDLPASDQLQYASELVKGKSSSGSAALYAQGLSAAASQFTGKQLTAENAPQLLQALLGGQSAAPAQPEPETSPFSGLLGSLLGGLTGNSASNQNDGLDNSDLLRAGMAFMQSQQQGESTMESIVDAVMAGSQMNNSAYRSQSGKLVANTLMQFITSKKN